MKKVITLILLFNLCTLYAQYDTKRYVDFFNYADEIFPVDIDEDGFLDILAEGGSHAQGHGIDKLRWYRNINGTGDFEPMIILDQEIASYKVAVGDLDNDGLIDILCKSGNSIVWYKNLSNGVDFNDPIPIETENIFINGVPYHIADFDNDGDQDFIDLVDQEFLFYENDGQANFNDPYPIIEVNPDINGYIRSLPNTSPKFLDIDNDENLDVVIMTRINPGPPSYEDFNKLAWLKNLGDASFGDINIIDDFEGFDEPDLFLEKSRDVDFDGRVDLVIRNGIGNAQYYWYKNLDDQGNFSARQLIDLEKHNVFIDLDNDGDLDHVITNVSTLSWKENLDGSNFGSLQHIDDAVWAREFTTIDINNDNILELFYRTGHTISFNAISGILGTDVESNNETLALYPNPTKNIVNIKSNKLITKVEIYNSIGQLILIKENSILIDISHLKSGIYLVNVEDNSSNITKEKIIKI